MVYDNTVINVGKHTVLNIFYFQGPPGEQGPRGEAGLKGDKVGSNISTLMLEEKLEKLSCVNPVKAINQIWKPSVQVLVINCN